MAAEVCEVEEIIQKFYRRGITGVTSFGASAAGGASPVSSSADTNSPARYLTPEMSLARQRHTLSRHNTRLGSD